MTQPVLRLVADTCIDPAVRKSRAACEQKAVSPDRCDRYDRCAPGNLLYADYLEKQNLRTPEHPPEPARASRRADPHAPQPASDPPKQKTQPTDCGLAPSLAPKLGDIPTDDPAMDRQHKRVITAYQVKRFAPTGALVDVMI